MKPQKPYMAILSTMKEQPFLITMDSFCVLPEDSTKSENSVVSLVLSDMCT